MEDDEPPPHPPEAASPRSYLRLSLDAYSLRSHGNGSEGINLPCSKEHRALKPNDFINKASPRKPPPTKSLWPRPLDTRRSFTSLPEGRSKNRNWTRTKKTSFFRVFPPPADKKTLGKHGPIFFHAYFLPDQKESKGRVFSERQGKELKKLLTDSVCRWSPPVAWVLLLSRWTN